MFQTRRIKVPAEPSTAVHVRRGDVSPMRGGTGWRYTDDEYVLALIRRVRQHLPSARVHIISYTIEGQTRDAFKAFEDEGFTLHLNADIEVDWAYMSRASGFVLTRSWYGHVPAYINQNCVVAEDYHKTSLPHWIDADLTQRNFTLFDERMSACVQNLSRV
eukprot:TRINITY_DN28274_c0_g1_i1.p1 TRINITY_DN28274_c0_g1~~TRINITY_DN28274_c0_g1_i1.p1  ORF type:complete len:161 (-),score=2.68 TRINITY_DN28274_c0_g1_i1:23-505(-)